MPIAAAPVVLPDSTPTDSTSPDGHIRAVTDEQYGGVILEVDYTLTDPTLPQPLLMPFTCAVYRQTPDGTISTVRGGDPYRNFAGRGKLYDQEGPLNQLTTYWVVPVLADGTDGPPCAGATVQTSQPFPETWLTNPLDPEAAINVYTSDTRSGTDAGRNNLQTVLGRKFPAAVIDTRSGRTSTMTLYTFTEDQYKAVEYLASLNFLQRRSISWEKPDGWFLIGDAAPTPGSASEGSGVFQWSFALTEWDRPSTAGQFVTIPGQTFKDRLAASPTFSQVPQRQFGGNLLLENDSEFEDSVAWSPGANTTVTQDLVNFRKGAASMLLTATAAGGVSSVAPYNVPVVPGQIFEYDTWVMSPQGGRTMQFEVDWKDAANNYLGFVQSVALPLTTLSWTRTRMQTLVPPGVYFATLILIGHATAAADAFNFDVVAYGPLL